MKIIDMPMQLLVNDQGLVMLAVTPSQVLPLGNVKTGEIYLARPAPFVEGDLEAYTGWVLRKQPDQDLAPETVARVALNYNLNLAARDPVSESETLEEAYAQVLASFQGETLGAFLGQTVQLATDYRNGQLAPVEAASLTMMVLSAVLPALGPLALGQPLMPTMDHAAADAQPSILVPGNDTLQ